MTFLGEQKAVFKRGGSLKHQKKEISYTSSSELMRENSNSNKYDLVRKAKVFP